MGKDGHKEEKGGKDEEEENKDGEYIHMFKNTQSTSILVGGLRWTGLCGQELTLFTNIPPPGDSRAESREALPLINSSI